MPISNPDALGRIVAERRRLHGIRQEDLALVAGTGLRFIHDLERGKPTVQLEKVLRALNALGLELELRDRAGQPVPAPSSNHEPRRVRRPSRGRPGSARAKNT